MLGLRYPVTRQGQPILVELGNPDALFHDGEQPEIRSLRILDVGSPEEPRGIRALESVKDEVHAITGNLDSDPEESVLVRDHPEGKGRSPATTAWSFRRTATGGSPPRRSTS